MAALWHVDTGLYKEAYFQAIESAQRELDPDLIEKLSVPEAVVLPDEYLGQPVRILVMGQETRDNCNPLAAAQNDAFSAWSTQIGASIAFDYAYGGNATQRGGKFWTAFDEIRSAFGRESRRSLAWSNAYQVQVLPEVAESRSVEDLEPTPRKSVVDWQKKLLRAAVEFTDPHAIIFLTGRTHWVAKEMFDSIKDENGVISASLKDRSIVAVQTYHPNARVSGVKSDRDLAIARLKAALSL